MFILTKAEMKELVTNCDRLDRLKHSSALPRVFTKQGVAMLSSVLKAKSSLGPFSTAMIWREMEKI